MRYFLGTALWGWTVPDADCFALLDRAYARGLRHIDTASNYPINGDSAAHGRAVRILCDWTRAHGVGDLSVSLKIGATGNDGTPAADLTPDALDRERDRFAALLGTNLETLMIHWDNRAEQLEIVDTCGWLAAQARAYEVGVSGIRWPDTWGRALTEIDLDVVVQVKHNFLVSDRARYGGVFPARSRYVAYGIAGGGMNLEGRYDPDSSVSVRHISHAPLAERTDGLRELIDEWHRRGLLRRGTFYEACLWNVVCTQEFWGVVLGPSRLAQLDEALDYLTQLEARRVPIAGEVA